MTQADQQVQNTHIGDLSIRTKADAKKYAAIEAVGGDLEIRTDASLPLLSSVGGYLYIGADVSLPLLTSVGGNLDISADASLPLLSSVSALYIRTDASLPLLTSVGGRLEICADASLPLLTSVGGDLYIGADAQLPLLTSVGDYLDISADAQLPLLASVGGRLEISADAHLPLLTTVGRHPATMAPICIQGLPWPVTILDEHMMIGCQTHSLADWARFTNREIASMDSLNAARFWAQQKAVLLGSARAGGRLVPSPTDAAV